MVRPASNREDRSAHPTPGPDEQLAAERDLLRRYAKRKDPAVREELVDRFMPLARRLASRYRGGAEPFDDLVQVASLGLVKALDRFDPERGTAFSSFAVPTILGELKRHFRDRGWSVHVLPTKLGRAPSLNEIAERLSVTSEDVLEAMHAAQTHHAVSLDASPVTASDEGAPLGERIGESDPSFEVVEYGEAIGRAMEDVSDRDREVLHLRFVEDLTQSEIAERVGVSQMHVSRILRATLEKLRTQVPEET
jgi:RNA polymerase sigma-B factor